VRLRPPSAWLSTLSRLVAAEGISSLGTRMTLVALPWFVLATTGSAPMAGAAFVAESLPVAVFGLLSGPVVGRLGSLRAMAVADWSRAVLIAAIPVLHLAGALSFALLLALLFSASVFYVPHFSAQRVALAEISPDEASTVRANGWLESAQQLAAVAGPALAGLLIALLGPAELLLIDAATFAISAALITPLARGHSDRSSGDGLGKGVLAGFRALLRDRPLSALALASFGLDLTFLPAIAIALPVYVRDIGAPASLLGGLLACHALGALGGALLLGRLSRRRDAAGLLVLGSVLQVLTFTGLAFGLPLWVAATMLLVGGSGNPVSRSAVMTLLARRTPAAVRPHVVTTYVTVVVSSQPLGAAIGGPVVGAFGPGVVFVAALVAFALGALGVLCVARSLASAPRVAVREAPRTAAVRAA
jgi:MFS family permease